MFFGEEGGLATDIEKRQKTGAGIKIRKVGRQERAKASNSKLHPPSTFAKASADRPSRSSRDSLRSQL
jgi:hypothetical protein